MFDAGCLMSDAGCLMSDAGCLMSDAGCLMSDAGCLMSDAGCLMSEADCSVQNGDCGTERNCIENTLNKNSYSECVCAEGKVLDKFKVCTAICMFNFQEPRMNVAYLKAAQSLVLNQSVLMEELTDGLIIQTIKQRTFLSFVQWISVDLIEMFTVHHVVLFNKLIYQSMNETYLTPFTIGLHKFLNNVANILKSYQLCGSWTKKTLNAGMPMKIQCSIGDMSRFVVVHPLIDQLVRYIGLNEIEVYATSCKNEQHICGNQTCVEVESKNKSETTCIQNDEITSVDIGHASDVEFQLLNYVGCFLGTEIVESWKAMLLLIRNVRLSERKKAELKENKQLSVSPVENEVTKNGEVKKSGKIAKTSEVNKESAAKKGVEAKKDEVMKNAFRWDVDVRKDTAVKNDNQFKRDLSISKVSYNPLAPSDLFIDHCVNP
ncbi:hypothetical protein HELRODRAFT_183386 [Helobdella robusta]|uniref:Uncharacterized protein n=1 Tax=Helobdella robusta TaxID=6412 RepID=T1FJJ8_HELRO|nr:hypothetical protein HELRODRAFT_183386 [Helobdella robusta]ESO11211.1 hypothetical protein HELRODRAFT_183386 [Helobdella robusta]